MWFAKTGVVLRHDLVKNVEHNVSNWPASGSFRDAGSLQYFSLPARQVVRVEALNQRLKGPVPIQFSAEMKEH